MFLSLAKCWGVKSNLYFQLLWDCWNHFLKRFMDISFWRLSLAEADVPVAPKHQIPQRV